MGNIRNLKVGNMKGISKKIKDLKNWGCEFVAE